MDWRSEAMRGVFLLPLLALAALGADPEEAQIQDKVRAALPTLIFSPALPAPKQKTAADLFPAQKGLDFVYDAVRWLIQRLQPRPFPAHLLPRELLQTTLEEYYQSFREHYVEWLSYEQGFLILGGVCILVCLLFTVVYVLYCCCLVCCCRDKSAKGKPLVDRRLDGCQRVVYTGIASLAVLGAIFALAIGFLSNQYLHASALNLPDFARNALDDLRSYRESENSAVRKLLTEDFGALNRTLVEGVRGASGALVTGVKAWSGASALDALTRLAATAEDVQAELDQLEEGLGRVETSARELQRQLSRLFASLQSDLEDCVVRASEASELCRTTKAVFEAATQLPLDTLTQTGLFTEMREKLATIRSYNIAGKLADARRQFASLEDQFRDEMARREVELRAQLSKYGANLSAYAELATQHFAKLQFSDAYLFLQAHNGTYQEYELYRWAGVLAMLVLLSLSVVAFGLGLFYGCCGKRPSYFEDDCCVRSSGSKLFTCGIVGALLCLVVFMCLSALLMLVGGNVENLLCDPLRRPDQRRDVFKVLEQLTEETKRFAGNELDPWLRQITIDRVLKGCESNETLYTILDLESRLNLAHILDGKAKEYDELAAALRSLTSEFSVPSSLSSLLSPEAEAEIGRLRNLSITGLPPELKQSLEEQIQAFALVDKVEALESQLGTLPESAGRAMLRRLLGDLEGVADSSARPLHSLLLQLEANLTRLEGRIPDLATKVPLWLNDLRNAELRLATNVEGLVRRVGALVADQLEDYVHTYRRHLKHHVENEVGSCEPLRRIASASIVAVCDRTLSPFNSVWAGLGLCLLLLMPIVVLATSLSRLYRNSHPYSHST